MAESNVAGEIQLAGAARVRPDGGQIVSVSIEPLDAMVALVDHQQMRLQTHGDIDNTVSSQLSAISRMSGPRACSVHIFAFFVIRQEEGLSPETCVLR